MATNAERQRAYKARAKAAGLVQVTGLVHPHQAAELYALMKMLKADRDYAVGPARHEPTGQLRRVRS